jgi:DNA polymerase-3 subunit delta'
VKFSEIFGHTDIKHNLMSAAKSGRIPHAQLFVSKEGSSSLALAVAYAQYIACINKGEEDSCGTCSSCVKFKQLIHPDLHLSFPIYGSEETSDSFVQEFREAFLGNPNMNINDFFEYIKGSAKKPNINIKECRNVIKKLSLKPYESEYKFLLMWLPEYLGKEGNILLKLIEEPPAKTIILFVTENQDQILTTIISRTQFVHVPRYSSGEIEQYLNEQNIASGELAKNISLMSEGNINRALVLSKEMENSQLEDFRQWLLDSYNGDVGKIIVEIDKYTEKGKERLKMFFQYGLQMLRSALIVDHQDISSKLTKGEYEFVQKLSKLINLKNADEIYRSFNRAIFELDRNGSVKLILINLSLKLKSCLRAKAA